MHNAAGITVNSLAYYAFWGFLIHFLKLLWSQIHHMTINGPGDRSVLLTVILDGNEQIELRSTPVNLPRFSEFILSVKPEPITWPRWEHSWLVEDGREECLQAASSNDVKMIERAKMFTDKQACSPCFLSMCAHGLRAITSGGDLNIGFFSASVLSEATTWTPLRSWGEKGMKFMVQQLHVSTPPFINFKYVSC